MNVVFSDLDLQLCLVVARDSDHHFHALVNRRRANDFNALRLERDGWDIFEVAAGDEVAAYLAEWGHAVALSCEFWTCACERDFIRHAGQASCPVCGTTQAGHTGRCLRAEALLRGCGADDGSLPGIPLISLD